MNWVYEYVGSSPTFFNIVCLLSIFFKFYYHGVEQMVAYKAHNLGVGGSNPPAVTLKEVAPQRSPCSPLNLFQVASQS